LNKPDLIVFGAGSDDLRASAVRLARQAEYLGWFNHIHLFDETSLDETYNDTFFRLDPPRSRGFGFWSWKLFLIRRVYASLSYADTLVYLDAGCELNERGVGRFNEYLEHSRQQGATLFHLPHLARDWTKHHPILNFDSHYGDRLQVVGGVLFFTKSERTNRLLDRWWELASHDGGLLLKDPLPTDPQRSSFQQHRHDQSLLSWAVFEQGFDTLADETYYEDWREGADKPVLTIRNKTGEPRLAFLMRPRWQRKLMRIFHLEPGLRR